MSCWHVHQFEFPRVIPQQPRGPLTSLQSDNAVVAQKVILRVRRPVPVKILRSRANDEPLNSEPARGDVCVILQTTNAYGNIHSLRDKVRDALAKIRRYVELWVLAGKTEQRGKHVPSPKGRRKLDAHTPYRLLMACSEEALSLIELTEHAEATCQVHLPFVRQGKSPGGSVNQLGTKTLFKPGNGLSDRTAGQSESYASRREASLLRRQDEFVETGKPISQHDFGIIG
jgi:hypothetical protein